MISFSRAITNKIYIKPLTNNPTTTFTYVYIRVDGLLLKPRVRRM